MKYTHYLEDERKIEYEENFWNGKKTIKLDSVELQQPKKKTFILDEKEYKIKGNFLTGVKLVGESEIVVVPSLKTWEYILACLPLFLLFIGGALGGFLGALGAIISTGVMRNSKNIVFKIAISVGITIVTVLCWYVIASFILELL